jgi:hypothetical protein
VAAAGVAEQVQVADKFRIRQGGAGGAGGGGLTVFGTPEYARACCEASLRCLGLEELRETPDAASDLATSSIACLQGRGRRRGEDGWYCV